ncbi:hypothetical protein TrRE_jg9356, partial [Triparma retinervis]
HAQAEAEKQVNRLKSDLHYDKLAREGQVKRARIMEHELTEVRHDNFIQTKLRSEAEHRSKKQYADLQKERSMRLQDIHERNKVMIAKRQSEKNEKIAEFSRFQVVEKANVLESKVGGLEAAVKSQTKIIALNDVELNASLAEIEAVKLESQRLKNDILQKDDVILHHVEIRKDLELECHRLKTELMITAQTASERSRPLSTAASGHAGISLSMERAKSGKTRPETTSAARIRRRAQTVRNREFSRTFTATSTNRSSTAGSRRGGRKAILPPGTPKNAITLDEAFIIPIQASPMDRSNKVGTSLLDSNGDIGLGRSSPGRLNSASVTFGQSQVFDGLRGTTPLTPGGHGRLPSAMKKTREGSRSSSNDTPAPHQDAENTHSFNNLSLDDSSFGGNNDVGFGSSLEIGGLPASRENSQTENLKKSDPFHVKLEKRRKARKQLNVPGSLFLGSGLGLRKEIE